eukprot:TRINITY_DN38106_c0_g1_i1.p1 TRINITY_DN38106_c0_g1~~TRINITY_DN38106_c0_g1_i1.p1  ORF type:complete len:123 (+),score=21.49 TRINITY_DN38106_c0_g1_i1:29-370(+)
MAPKSSGTFRCSVCAFTCRYDYFGRSPSQGHPAVRWLEDIFALTNPTPEAFGNVRTICLGAPCGVCAASVCTDSTCSLFYKIRFCKSCAQEAQGSFPPAVAEGLAKDLRKLLH